MTNLKASAAIGLIVGILAILVHATGLFLSLDAVMQLLLGIQPFVPAGQAPLFLALGMAFAAAWMAVDINGTWQKIAIATATSLLLFTGSLVLSLYGWFFSPFVSIFAVLGSLALALAWGKTKAGARKQMLERLFGQRLSRSAFHRVLESGAPAAFPGRVVRASVLVVSVQNHAELMELLSPEDYTSITNLFLKTASDYLVDSGGYLDECNGECIRVVFGAPLSDERHAVHACRAALDLAVRLNALNKECDARWQRRLDVRMGLDSGDISASAFGGGRLGSFSVAGPAVDFARRLCASCSTYGTRILIGPDTYNPAAETIEVRPIEIFKASSQRRRIEIYEILTPKNGLSPERERSRDHFWTGVLHYRERHWDKAVEEFTKARISGIHDEALDFYLRRIEQARRKEEESHRDSAPLIFQVV